MICHEPLEFVNGKQRCGRCGKTVSPEAATALDPRFMFCEDDEGTSSESIQRGSALRPGQRLCDIGVWSDELKHVAGSRTGQGQKCARCGEPVRVFAEDEPLPSGAAYAIRYEQRGDGPITWSGHLISVPHLDRTPICLDRP